MKSSASRQTAVKLDTVAFDLVSTSWQSCTHKNKILSLAFAHGHSDRRTLASAIEPEVDQSPAQQALLSK
jgi:hypothetical protein